MEWKGINEGPLPHLRNVLQEWLNLNERAVQSWEGDIPWRYNERATLGVFAGAIWLKGGFVIEEYSTKKNSTVEAYNSDYFGRCDMWFELEGKEYDVEAKICFRPLHPSVDPNHYIDETMRNALDDARKLKRYDPNRIHCGLVMSIPWLNYSRRYKELIHHPDKLEEQLMRWVSSVKSQNAASAWFIRDDFNWPEFPDGVRPTYLYPGIALLIKSVDHS